MGTPYIGEDFNARLYERQATERGDLGPFIIERKGCLNRKDIDDYTLENQTMFVDMLIAHDLIAASTWWQQEGNI